MRQSALCDSHSKMFEEPEDPTNRSFFSEIISSISDVKFSNSGRYMISRWGGFWLHSAKLFLCHSVISNILCWIIIWVSCCCNCRPHKECHSDVSPSNLSRDYLSVKVWDLHMESKPIETFTVHEYLRSKLCSLYENDCIFDKFEVIWLPSVQHGHVLDQFIDRMFKVGTHELSPLVK